MSTRFPTPGPGVYTRTHTKSFSYAQGSTTAPPPPTPSIPPPQAKNMKVDPKSTRAADEASALAMLSEIMREELFLQSEEVRLADRPPERLTKLREAHKEWIVWRVRKELDKLRTFREAEQATSEKLEEERRRAGEKDRAKREAEEQRRAQEEQRRLAEDKARERERTLKEERDRAAREQGARSKTPGSGPHFPWQRRFASSSSKDNNNSGYGTDRETGPRSFDPPPRSHTTAPVPTNANREWNREATIARSGWDAYQSRWAALNASASTSQSDSSNIRGLRFGDIPWPIFSNGPFMPADITSKTVGAFLLSPFHSVDKSTKERLRAALIQWHPDKFEARWLHLIGESEKALVTEGVGAVARAVNDLLAANR